MPKTTKIAGTESRQADKSLIVQANEGERVLQLIQELEGLYSGTRQSLLDRIEAERKLGKIWKATKRDIISVSSLSVEQWVRTNLSFSQQYANRCAQLAANFDAFEAAHNWYCQSGTHEGWRTKKCTGVDYALEVIALHKKAQKGGTPDQKAINYGQKVSARRKVADLEQALAESGIREEHLFSVLSDVYRRYRLTQEGCDYTEPVLHAELLAGTTRKAVPDAIDVASRLIGDGTKSAQEAVVEAISPPIDDKFIDLAA